MNQREQNREFVFSIEESFGVLSTNQRGWSKELNLVSFNGMPARYDLRDWSPDHEKMSRGISLSADEIKALHGLLLHEFGSGAPAQEQPSAAAAAPQAPETAGAEAAPF